MRALMFDEKGDPHSWSEADVNRSAHAHAGVDLVRFHVVNAGWAGVLLTDNRLCVAIRPAKVAGAALVAALFFVSDMMDVPCELVLYSGQQATSHLFPTKQALIQALCTATSEARVKDQSRFRRRMVDRAVLAEQDGLANLVSLREELNGTFDFERLWRSLNQGARGRFAIVRQDVDCLRLSALGKGFKELAHYWPHNGPLSRLKDQPDVHYGDWVNNAYEEALTTDQPLMEQVDCEIAWPHVGMRRHRYWRVVLPFVGSDGTRLVLSATIPDDGIDLIGTGRIESV